MKRSFSWPLFLAAAAVLTAVTWFLVKTQETRIAGTLTSIIIAWGFVRFCVVDDVAEAEPPSPDLGFTAGEDADSLVRNNIWSRGSRPITTPADIEERLKLPLLAVVSRRASTSVG
jgi:hypothetical protein